MLLSLSLYFPVQALYKILIYLYLGIFFFFNCLFVYIRGVYLSIYYSHIGLDYEYIYTTLLLLFVKKFSLLFSPLNCSLGLLIYFFIFILF